MARFIRQKERFIARSSARYATSFASVLRMKKIRRGEKMPPVYAVTRIRPKIKPKCTVPSCPRDCLRVTIIWNISRRLVLYFLSSSFLLEFPEITKLFYSPVILNSSFSYIGRNHINVLISQQLFVSIFLHQSQFRKKKKSTVNDSCSSLQSHSTLRYSRCAANVSATPC